jgi:hypothetical protein
MSGPRFRLGNHILFSRLNWAKYRAKSIEVLGKQGIIMASVRDGVRGLKGATG